MAVFDKDVVAALDPVEQPTCGLELCNDFFSIYASQDISILIYFSPMSALGLVQFLTGTNTPSAASVGHTGAVINTNAARTATLASF